MCVSGCYTCAYAHTHVHDTCIHIIPERVPSAFGVQFQSAPFSPSAVWRYDQCDSFPRRKHPHSVLHFRTWGMARVSSQSRQKPHHWAFPPTPPTFMALKSRSAKYSGVLRTHFTAKRGVVRGHVGALRISQGKLGFNGSHLGSYLGSLRAYACPQGSVARPLQEGSRRDGVGDRL